MSPNQFPGQTLAPVPASALLGSDDQFSSWQKINQLFFNLVSNPPDVGPPAPVITSVTPGTDGGNPVLTFDFTSAQWDVYSYEYDTHSDFSTGTVEANIFPGTVGGSQEINPFFTPLLPNTQYWIRMKVQLGGVDSGWSNTATGTTP